MGSASTPERRCKTCKWWEGTGDTIFCDLFGKEVPEGAWYDTTTESHYCEHPLVAGDRELKQIPIDGVVASEPFEVWTGPEFGCIHWEKTGD